MFVFYRCYITVMMILALNVIVLFACIRKVCPLLPVTMGTLQKRRVLVLEPVDLCDCIAFSVY